MKLIYLNILALALLLFSCEGNKIGPITPSAGVPSAVTIDSVVATHGGAMVYYTLPHSEDLLTVRAIYTLNGTEAMVESSLYSNKVEIVGLNTSEEVTANLYAINRAMEESKATTVKFTPLESPLNLIVETVKIIPDFGGATVTWENETNLPITMEFITENEDGNLQAIKIMTTETAEGSYSMRGYDTELRTFGVVISDNYNYVTDTLYSADGAKLAPLYEEQITKKDMKIFKLDNDADWNAFGENENNLLDDNNFETIGHTANNTLPAPVTIDMGRMAKLSRIMMYPRNYANYYYVHGNPVHFDVYVYNGTDEPSRSGDWSEWTKAIECEIVKPSGLGIWTETDEDISTALQGFGYSFSIEQEAVRYVRVVVLDSWGGGTFTHVGGIEFFGEMRD